MSCLAIDNFFSTAGVLKIVRKFENFTEAPWEGGYGHTGYLMKLALAIPLQVFAQNRHRGKYRQKLPRRGLAFQKNYLPAIV